MTYDLEIDPPPYGADGVDHFLFDQRRGYSEYFGSAMVVMLRSVGIPARMVTGYSVGDKLADEDVYLVKDNHSHGWAEVFFPRYGWIPFEPTPGKDLPETFIPTPLETRVIVLDGSIDELETICEEDIEECEPGESPAGGSAFGDDGGLTQRLGRSLPWLIGLLCFVLAGIAGGRYFWWKAMEPSPDVEVMFRRLGILGRLNSVGPKPHETPYQYGRRLGEVLPEQQGPFSLLIGLYVRRRYGRKDPSREEIDGMTEPGWRSECRCCYGFSAPGIYKRQECEESVDNANPGLKCHLFETPVGWVALLGGSGGLRQLSLKPTSQEALDELGDAVSHADWDADWFIPVQQRMERYLEGDPKALDEIQLDLKQAPPFFKSAWEACRSIPCGETRSYGWLAEQAGSPLAVRAAGQAMARNRWPLIIPCHRVIGADGGCTAMEPAVWA